jgi:7-cyano-7-deazaguanine synthase
MNKVAVLVSGGLDSGVLVAGLARRAQVYPVYVRQGLFWENAELYWLRRYLKKISGSTIQPLQIFELPVSDIYGKHWSVKGGACTPGPRSSDNAVFLPGRNLILTVKAAVFCVFNGIHELCLGSLENNPFPDATASFFERAGRLFTEAFHFPLVVSAPFRKWDKAEVVLHGRSLPLHLTFSCLKPVRMRHCGKCNKCAERRKAFKAAKLPDPTLYN